MDKDPDGTILFCSRCFSEMMKTSIQEAMGRKVRAFVAGPQWLPLQTLLADARAGPVQQRLTLRAADGTACASRWRPSAPPTPGRKPSTFLYRAGRELLLSVVKHARTDEARLRVRRLSRCLCLSVSDHGRGFDPRELRETAGSGLLSIRERIELLGGRMKIRSAKGQGSVFRIVVPDGEKPVDRGQRTENKKATRCCPPLASVAPDKKSPS